MSRWWKGYGFVHTNSMKVNSLHLTPGQWSMAIVSTWLVSSTAGVATANGCTNRWQSPRSEEHTSELQSLTNLVCRLLLEKKKIKENVCVMNDIQLDSVFILWMI